jgi:hypothetical protein
MFSSVLHRAWFLPSGKRAASSTYPLEEAHGADGLARPRKGDTITAFWQQVLESQDQSQGRNGPSSRSP